MKPLRKHWLIGSIIKPDRCQSKVRRQKSNFENAWKKKKMEWIKWHGATGGVMSTRLGTSSVTATPLCVHIRRKNAYRFEARLSWDRQKSGIHTWSIDTFLTYRFLHSDIDSKGTNRLYIFLKASQEDMFLHMKISMVRNGFETYANMHKFLVFCEEVVA